MLFTCICDSKGHNIIVTVSVFFNIIIESTASSLLLLNSIFDRVNKENFPSTFHNYFIHYVPQNVMNRKIIRKDWEKCSNKQCGNYKVLALMCRSERLTIRAISHVEKSNLWRGCTGIQWNRRSSLGLWVDMYVYVSVCASRKVPHANLTISLLKTEWTVNVTIHVSLADSFGCCVKSSTPLKLPTRCFICWPLTAGWEWWSK